MPFTFPSAPAPAPLAPGSGGIFGAPATAPAAAPTAAAPGTGFTFGGFGGTNTPAPAPPPFGGFYLQAAAPAPAPSGLSGGFTYGVGQQQPQLPQQQQQQQQQQQATGFAGIAAPAAQDAGSASAREFEKLAVAYRDRLPSGEPNPGCRMKHVVYNQVDPALRNSYKRPAFIDDKTWKKAEEDNPDPSKLTPTAVIGWENLRERLVEQQKEMAKMAEFVTLMQTTTSNGLRSVTLIRTRMEASRRRHLAQAHRFLKIQRKLDAVRCMNKPLHDAERQLRVALDNVHRSLGPPQQALKDLNSLLLQGERQTEEVEEITDPEKLRRIFQALEGQRDGLEHLMRIVKKDKQDLEIMMKSRMMTQ